MQSSHNNPEELISIFKRYEDPAIEYLQYHLSRFIKTRDIVYERWDRAQHGDRILDIGAHWLHNSVLYALDGFKVTAAELTKEGLSHPNVTKLAKDYNINTLLYNDLENPSSELKALEENSFDLLFFLEIIEHITFNPVTMWKILYSLLKPGGRIIITTPNYYAISGSFLKDLKNIFTGRSAGLDINRIIEYNTRGPHWKEFSEKDIKAYFNNLSSDFVISKVVYTDYNPPHTKLEAFVSRRKTKFFKKFLPNLHIEIDLVAKIQGIVAEPHW